MDIQQQNYLSVNAIQHWYIFFYQIYHKFVQVAIPFFLQTAIYSEHQNAWLARLPVMLKYLF